VIYTAPPTPSPEIFLKDVLYIKVVIEFAMNSTDPFTLPFDIIFSKTEPVIEILACRFWVFEPNQMRDSSEELNWIFFMMTSLNNTDMFRKPLQYQSGLCVSPVMLVKLVARISMFPRALDEAT
jgi:hypothetical protein